MAALITAVFIASLLGSLHCAGMCGPLAAFAVVPQSGHPTSGNVLALQCAYNGGRLLTYVVLGALAGLFGAALDLGGSLVGIQRAAMILAGALMIAVGSAVALQSLGWRISVPSPPRALARWIARGHAVAVRWPAPLRAVTVGLLTGFLPCGWLYAFVVAAAGTGSPARGALILFAFWAGTLPVLAALGVGVQQLAARSGPRVQVLTALVVVALGVMSLLGRWDLTAATQPAPGRPPLSAEPAAQKVESLRDAEPPCHNDEP